MEWNWEEFEHGPVDATSKRLHVTIDPRGHLFLNRHAIEAMGEPDAVTLMYDRRRSTIGLKRSPLGKPNAYRLKRKSKTSGRIIYTAQFCRHYSICPDETLAFVAAEVNKHGVLILDLNEVKAARR
jgi:hypothetical protein